MDSIRIPTLLALACLGCARADPEVNPQHVERLIEAYGKAPVTNPPASIWRYSYRGKTVYYVPPSCCDVPGALYDTSGNPVCGPDGGISGRGDGKCPDFFERRTDEHLVWRDAR